MMNRRFPKLLQVTWLDLGLVLLLEAIAFIIHGLLGETVSINEFILDSSKLLLWSLPICIVLTFIERKSIFMGIAGLILTPCSTLIAGVLESQFREILTSVFTEGTNTIGLAALRGIEYAILGAALGFLAERQQDSYVNYALTGLLTGLVFTILLLTQTGISPGLSLLTVFTDNIDEFIFPIGCALIVKFVK
jgi:hypothetical protein